MADSFEKYIEALTDKALRDGYEDLSDSERTIWAIDQSIGRHVKELGRALGVLNGGGKTLSERAKTVLPPLTSGSGFLALIYLVIDKLLTK